MIENLRELFRSPIASRWHVYGASIVLMTFYLTGVNHQAGWQEWRWFLHLFGAAVVLLIFVSLVLIEPDGRQRQRLEGHRRESREETHDDVPEAERPVPDLARE